VLAVLVDERGRGGQYADPVAPSDRPMSLRDLGRGDAISTGGTGRKKEVNARRHSASTRRA
jgi:hypothetical protein